MSNPSEPSAEGLSSFISTLLSEAGREKGGTLPPVHLWSPANCGDIGLQIRRDGSWWQDGVRFTREKLVRLFSTILRRDPDGYYLVTPYEKVSVAVEDAPFIAVRADRTEGPDGQVIAFTTNVGDVVVLDGDHPLEVRQDAATGEPRPYVRVRGGLDARLGRQAFYDLVAWSEPVGEDGRMRVASAGALFTLGDCGEPVA